MINKIFEDLNKEVMMESFNFDKASFLMDMVDQNHDMMYQEAAVSVFVNDRSFDDLGVLYEAADNETNEKKSGLISQMFNAIANIFRAIVKSVKNFFNNLRGNKVPDKVTLNKDDAAAMNYVNDAYNAINRIPMGAKIGLATTGVVAAALSATGLYKHFNKKKDNNTTTKETVEVDGKKAVVAQEKISKMSELFSKIFSKKQDNGDNENKVDNAKENKVKDGKNKSNPLSLIKEFGGKLSELCGKIASSLLNAIKRNKKSSNEPAAETNTNEPAAVNNTNEPETAQDANA